MATLTAAPAARTGVFAPLQNTNFRLYFFGQLISTSGTWMQNVAQGYLVFQLTRSELWLGVVACAMGIPILLITPFAGVIVERMSRRQLLLLTQSAMMSLALILAALVFTNAVQIWHIVVLALLLGTCTAFDAPARQTFISDLVEKDLLPGGIALNSIIINGSRTLGPTVAGILLITLGTAWCFLLNGLSFLVVIGSLLLMRLETRPSDARHSSALTELREGLRYVRRHPVVPPLLMLSASGSFFGWSTMALMPAFSDEILRSPETGFALVTAASGLGAVLAGLLIATLTRKFERGRIVAFMAIATPVFALLLSRMTTVPTAVLMSLGAGFSIIAYFVSINTAIQLVIDNELRARVLSLYTLTIMGLNPFGALLLGTIAERIGTPDALTLFALTLGAICTAVLVRFPQVRQIR